MTMNCKRSMLVLRHPLVSASSLPRPREVSDREPLEARHPQPLLSDSLARPRALSVEPARASALQHNPLEASAVLLPHSALHQRPHRQVHSVGLGVRLLPLPRRPASGLVNSSPQQPPRQPLDSERSDSNRSPEVRFRIIIIIIIIIIITLYQFNS